MKTKPKRQGAKGCPDTFIMPDSIPEDRPNGASKATVSTEDFVTAALALNGVGKSLGRGIQALVGAISELALEIRRANELDVTSLDPKATQIPTFCKVRGCVSTEYRTTGKCWRHHRDGG